MARPRQKDSGKWEIGLRHPSLPGGRKYFTFDSEAEALAYGEQWKLMKLSGIAPPAELLKPAAHGKSLGFIVRQYANSGLAAPSAASPPTRSRPICTSTGTQKGEGRLSG